MRPSRLRVEELRQAMRGRLIGREIHVLESIGSTNDAIQQRLTPETPTGLTIFAERQTAGHGQRGKIWESAAAKGLWFSVLLRPQIALRDSAQLTSWAAAAVRDTLVSLGLQAIVKPPNDVFLAGQKIAGVLVEMRAQSDAPHVAILGIGLNVNHASEDFSTTIRGRATSIALALGRELDRTDIAAALLRRLNDSYGR